MLFISYSQNFEDVILMRAFRHVEAGFYIDIGANHPRKDSVSRAFYERGWRGFHVEPQSHYAALLREDRPDETVLQAVITDSTGVVTFYEIPLGGGGLSTGDAALADVYRGQGVEVREHMVPALSLDQMLSGIGEREIHWLKIDVEGLEEKVISGWRTPHPLPWVIVIESTIPCSDLPNYDRWESQLLERGYSFVYADGLNRYYLSPEHPELAGAFTLPPNLFDGFQLSGQASAPFCVNVQNEFQSRYQTLEAEYAEALRQRDQEQECLRAALAGLEATRDKAVAQVYGLRDAVAEERSKAAERERALVHMFAHAKEEADESVAAALRLLVDREGVAARHEQDLRGTLAAERARFAAVEREARDIRAELHRALVTATEREVAHTEAAGRLLEEAAGREAAQSSELQQVLAVSAARETSYAETLAALERQVAQKRGRIGALEGLLATLSQERDHALVALQHSEAELRQKQAELEQSVASYAALQRQVQDQLLLLRTRLDSNFLIRVLGGSRLVAAVLGPVALPLSSPPSSIAKAKPDDRPVNMENAVNTLISLSTIETILRLYDTDFLREAYRTILGRDPDINGQASYLAHLRSGGSRRLVLAALYFSGEGRNRGAGIEKVGRALGRYRWLRWPLLGRVLAHLDHGRISRNLRAIENTIYLGDKRVSDRLSLAQQSLDEVVSMLRENRHLAQAVPPSQPAAVAVDRYRRDDRVDEIYTELRREVVTVR